MTGDLSGDLSAARIQVVRDLGLVKFAVRAEASEAETEMVMRS